MFTGALSITRREAQSILEELGGVSGSSVSRNTDYLVVGEKPGSKLWKAQMLDIKCIDEGEFRELLKKEETAAVVHLTPEEQDNPGLISDEKWEQIAALGVPIITGKTLETLLKKLAPSYENSETAEKLKEYIKQGKGECPHCGETIPYSIHNDYYYCFKCHHYSYETEEKHRCIWSRFDKKFHSRTKRYLACSFCHNFQHYTKRMIKLDILVDQVKESARLDYRNSLEYPRNQKEGLAEEDRLREEKEVEDRASFELGVNLGFVKL